MAIEIDVLNLERSITALAAVLRDSGDRAELIRESFAGIDESLCSLESIAGSLERIMAAVETIAQRKRRSTPRKRTLKAVGT